MQTMRTAVDQMQQNLLTDLKAIEAPEGAQLASARVIRLTTLGAAQAFGLYYKAMKHGELPRDDDTRAEVRRTAEELQFLMIVAAQWDVDLTDIVTGFEIMAEQFRDWFFRGIEPSTTH